MQQRKPLQNFLPKFLQDSWTNTIKTWYCSFYFNSFIKIVLKEKCSKLLPPWWTLRHITHPYFLLCSYCFCSFLVFLLLYLSNLSLANLHEWPVTCLLREVFNSPRSNEICEINHDGISVCIQMRTQSVPCTLSCHSNLCKADEQYGHSY